MLIAWANTIHSFQAAGISHDVPWPVLLLAWVIDALAISFLVATLYATVSVIRSPDVVGFLRWVAGLPNLLRRERWISADRRRRRVEIAYRRQVRPLLAAEGVLS